MTKISDTSKVFVILGTLTVFINAIKDKSLKHGAKLWYSRLNNTGRSLWKEIQKVTNEESELCNTTFDNLEGYAVEVLTVALDIDVENMDEFVEYIKKFKPNETTEETTK